MRALSRFFAWLLRPFGPSHSLMLSPRTPARLPCFPRVFHASLSQRR